MTKPWSSLPIVMLFGATVLLTALAGLAAEDQPAARVREVEGSEIFKNHCASCHGVDARGHGPIASSLKHHVPDLTLISQQSGGKFPSDRVKQVIDGSDSPSAHGNREMPVWGPLFHHIDKDQDFGPVRLEAVSKYLESIQRK